MRSYVFVNFDLKEQIIIFIYFGRLKYETRNGGSEETVQHY